MDPLSLVTACALVLQPGPNGLRCMTSTPQRVQTVRTEEQPGVSKWRSEIAQAAERFRIPEAWIGAVMGAESGGHTTLNGRSITSSAGAMGLMQLMPGTYSDLRQRYGLGTDPYDPHDNILAGTAYLREMYQRYGYPHLFGAYNAGPGRFDAYLLNGKPLPSETRAYVDKILPGVSLSDKSQAPQATPPSSGRAIKRARIGSQNALFFVKLSDESASKNPDLPTTTHAENARAEGVLFVPLRRDLHKPEN